MPPIQSPSHHFRRLFNSISSFPPSKMARVISLAVPFSLKPTLAQLPTVRYLSFPPTHHRAIHSVKSSLVFGTWVVSGSGNGGQWNVISGCGMKVCCGGNGFGGGERGYRKVRRRFPKKSERELELSVKILIEEGLPNDPEILSIAEMLRLNAPMAMKLAFEGLKNSEYKTRETSINDVGGFETIELSLLLCNDEFIQKLNKDWRDEDHATDVLSMSQHIPELKLPILMLGDIVISVETAARQAEERGHSLLDEIRILLVHGLLHLLGFDHELNEQSEEEMEKEEELLLGNLGWKGKGLIKAAYDAENGDSLPVKNIYTDGRKKEGSLRFYRPKFKYIFCDMDGTLLNSKSEVSSSNADAIREAMSRGVQVVIATGKARSAAMDILKTVDLVGIDRVLSESSPGVFLQLCSLGNLYDAVHNTASFVLKLGLLVFGKQGREIFKRSLDPDFCRKVFAYSLEHQIALAAFCGDRMFTLSDHPLVRSLHDVYREPKAETLASADDLLAASEVQKLVFLDTTDKVANSLRPYWLEATGDHASVVQALPDMLELVPHGTSKGSGVKLLLDHLGVTPNEVMAIGDGENDIEMLKLASLGVALSNGAEKTKAIADVIGVSNNEDGVADAIYRYAF